ncbi:MAG: aspartate carbamoyltransferase [Chloroflexi bacterium]|nr:aspartate carbamoyltransferase [Chloroflexota bacterium]
MRHILEAQQFDKKTITLLFHATERMEQVAKAGGSTELHGKIMGTLFYSISTRTRLSFEAAMLRLGGNVVSTEHPQEFSDSAIGGTIEDTIRMMASFVDVIVLRHPHEGSAAKAAAVSSVPVINAGDGGDQHPTQALLDLYTIYRAMDGIDGASVVMMGDLANSRTVRSLCYFLGKYTGVKLWLVAPPEHAMRPDIIDYLTRHGVAFTQVSGAGEQLTNALRTADVVYQTDLPPDKAAASVQHPSRMDFAITRKVLQVMRQRAIIMHPFPRTDAIAREVDDDRRAFYFQQITNGLYIRMALLHMLLGNNA